MTTGFVPWAQEAALAPGAPQKAPAEKKQWWEDLTMPWQERHWTDPQPDWTRTVGKAGLGVGLAAGGAALGLGGPSALFGASRFLPWLANPALSMAAHPTAMGMLGGMGGLMASANIAPGELGEPVPQAMAEPPPVTPPVAPPTLPTPGEFPGEEAGLGPTGQPQVIEVGGQQFWWNPTGGIYGTGGWDLISGARGLTPEQQMAESEAGRTAQMARLQEQYKLEQQAMGTEAGLQRGTQGAAAAQQMAQMYAADPYKYWAQMGQGTPEAVARLTRGEIGPGEEMGQVPLSTPSAQWWGGLLPSEQQQIAGGLNWLGVDPQDWYSMYQRMIPGLAQRQPGPQWAR